MALTESSKGTQLSLLLRGLADCNSCDQIMITGLSMDSRDTAPGDLFLACHGTKTSGINFIRDAINAGAAAIAAEADAGLATFVNNIPVISVGNLGSNAGTIAARYYDHPSEKMRVVGVTGTNGKTSVAYFIAQALTAGSKWKAGLMGTLGYGPYPQLRSSLNTTPDPVTVQRTLADFYSQGIETAIMEVTSIGLAQYRVRGVNFDIGIYTNLSVDHLDYHSDMLSYAAAKKQLFTSYGLRHAVINIDDEYGRTLGAEISDSVNVVGYGLVEELPKLDNDRTVHNMLAVVEDNDQGMTLSITGPWGRGKLSVAISGSYNAYNLLASLTALCLLNIPFDVALEQLSMVTPVPGRLEKFGGKEKPSVFVDYAHTPDALRNVLTYLRGIKTGKLLCVFGCGGNRDKTKRPQMGAIAKAFADELILTNDNPRNEDPDAIIKDILAGIRDKESVCIEPDRKQAITNAIRSAAPNDIVLIAGKGHEAYQEIAGQRYPFSDRQLVRSLLGTD